MNFLADTIHCQSKEIDIGVIPLTKLQSLFGFHHPNMCSFGLCVFVLLHNRDLCNNHHNQDMELSHNHSKSPGTAPLWLNPTSNPKP